MSISGELPLGGTAGSSDRLLGRLEFRPDLDGLRGLGMLCVLLVHAGYAFVPGARYMLDMFFVLSGYLITYQIVYALQREKFSLSGFYLRRIRRIIPALYVALFFGLIVSFLFFPAESQWKNGAIILGATFSASNLVMAYFPEYEFGTYLLRQTWSLGVEEQFYFVFPLVTLMFFGTMRMRVWIPLLVLGLNSFVWAAAATQSYDPWDYYLPQYRTWEFMAGALVVFLPAIPIGKTQANILTFAGLVLLMGVTLMNTPTAFKTPGPWALTAVVSTAVMIKFAHPSHISFRCLAIGPLVWLGKISYSTYIWHVVLYETARIVLNRGFWLGYKGSIALIVASILLAWLSWRFVETPFRGSNSRFSDRQVIWLFVLFTLILTAMGLYLILGDVEPLL